MKPVFLDTGYLIGLEVKNDQHHEAARSHWAAFSRSLPGLVTTSYVFDETVTFFNSRGLHAKAIKIGSLLLESPRIDCVHVGPDLFTKAWTLFKANQDKRYSLTDCVSFVVMREQEI